MKVLSDQFQVDPDPTEDRRSREQARRIECKFERQKREIEPIIIKRSPVAINPLRDILEKGIGV